MWGMRDLRRGIATLLVLLALGTSCGCRRAVEQGTAVGAGPVQPTSTMLKASLVPSTVPSAAADPYARDRQNMVKLQIEDRGIQDKDVLRAMETVRRHEFVPPEYLSEAYADHPLPIGYGQTISQPYMVAVMTELLRLRSESRVLEIGTGSGYQAAILSLLAKEVYSVEIVVPLCEQAKERLARLGYTNVQIKCGDGYYGWEEHAPYDAIIVTCAPDHIPQPLINQLTDGGHMVIPVGPPGMYQVLWLVERHGEEVKSERMMGVAFVPLTGEH